MRYSSDTTLSLEPCHERMLLGDEEIDLADHNIQIQLDQRIHNPSNPHVTYWEITYLGETPTHEIGDTRVVTENLLTTYEIVEGSSATSEYDVFCDPNEFSEETVPEENQLTVVDDSSRDSNDTTTLLTDPS